MDLDRKNIIDNILQGNSKQRLRESFFIKNYIDIYNLICDFSENIKDLPFKQKVWHWVNDINYYIKCKCGGDISFNRNWIDGYRRACSPRCAQSMESTKSARKETVLLRYGSDNVSKLDSIREKISNTNLKKYGDSVSSRNVGVKEKTILTNIERYGSKYYFETDEFKSKSRSSNLVRYGKEHYTQTSEYIDKSIETNMRRYGTMWPTMSDIVKNRTITTNLKKYGKEYYTQTTLFKDRMILLNNRKYGVDYFYQSDYFRKKSISTNIFRYGVSHFSQSESYKDYIKSDRYKISKLRWRVNFYKERGFDFISPTDNENVILRDLNCLHEFEIHPTNLQRRITSGVKVCTVCNPINSIRSGQEENISLWIKNLGINVENNNRTILNPYEIDIYLPDNKIAIEYNGLYWHSDIRIEDKNYHYNKTKLCRESGIKMIHIWEDDWLYKQNIVKSIISYKIGIIKNKISARKCEVRIVDDKKIIYDFFNNNHIQGICKYKTCIGLFYKGELVSSMIFNKNRGHWELVRFCSKIDTVVVGGSSRLFNHFISNNLNISSIITYADVSQFDGEVYNKLGFKFNHLTVANYWWVINGIRRHRFTYNKKKLIKMGGDPKKTEVQIMYENGYHRIYGCGHEKWTWCKS